MIHPLLAEMREARRRPLRRCLPGESRLLHVAGIAVLFVAYRLECLVETYWRVDGAVVRSRTRPDPRAQPILDPWNL